MKQILESHINNGLTVNEIASELGVSRITIFNWLKKHQLKTKFKQGQTKNNKGCTGQISHLRKSCWELNRPLRIKRLWLEFPERNTCERCDSTKNLEVHHKDKNRMNNKKQNIQVLCHKCHRVDIHNCSDNLHSDGGWSKR